MERDLEKIARIRRALDRSNIDLLACTLPANVLLLSGYWPVIGTSLVLVSREGRVVLLVPEDEKELAAHSWADDIRVFKSGSLTQLVDLLDAMIKPLEKVATGLGPRNRIGYESGPAFEPFSYVALHVFGASIRRLLGEAFFKARLCPAENLLARLRSEKTETEIEHIRQACAAAATAFTQGALWVRSGEREFEAAAHFRNSLPAAIAEGVARADGFVYCMSGPNSAEAYRAYARSRGRQLSRGDLALFHCNSYVDGYWTDITRTYCLGEPSKRQSEMYAAVRAASTAAFDAVHPGARASEVDFAARSVLAERGFKSAFKHATGHGVGFVAIDHNARPRLHPKSSDILKSGMVCNIEPAIYVKDYGGIRHCDMIAVNDCGAELLTPFHSDLDALVIERTAG